MFNRCLYISARLCAPSYPAAGHKLAASKLNDMVHLSEWVDVITFEDGESSNMLTSFATVEYHRFRVTRKKRILGALRYPWLPVAASSRKILANKTAARLLASNKYDCIYVDFTQTLELIPRQFRSQATVRVHDVFDQLYRRQISSARGPRRLVGIIELFKVKFWESKLLSQAGSIVALNEKDRDIVAQMSGVANVSVSLPDPTYYVTDRSRETIEPGLILFWGNMSRIENIDAVEYFVSEIFPFILSKNSNARLIVAGANPPQRVSRLSSDKITVTGFVEDPGDIFRKSEIAIVPLRQGAGIKIKVLELIKSGVPTISTSIGAEGISASPLLSVHNDSASFANACIDLLTDVPIVV